MAESRRRPVPRRAAPWRASAPSTARRGP